MMKPKQLQVVAATTLAAVLFWGLVKLGGTFETTVAVRLLPENIPAGLTPASRLPQNIRLTLQGDGLHLVLLLWNIDDELRVDMQAGGGSQKFLAVKDVARSLKLPSDVQVVSMTPDTLLLDLTRSSEKKVPVVLETDLTFAEGFGLSEPPDVSPESITVSGPQSVLASLKSWTIGPLVFRDVKNPFEYRAVAGDTLSPQLTFDPAYVEVRFNVQPFAEKTVSEIPVDVLEVPSSSEVILIPPRIGIIVRGGIDRLAELAPGDCRASIGFEELVGDTIRSVVPRIELPPGLTLIARNPEKLQFVIRKRL